MTAPVPEQAVTAAEIPTAALIAASGVIHHRLGLALDAGGAIECKPIALEALEAAAPAIRDHLVSQLAIADTTTCGECNYPLHRCPACRHLIGHDGYDDHQCRAVIDVKGEITPGQAEELEAKRKAAWQAAGGRPELPADYGQIQEHREVLAERVAELEALAADMLARFDQRPAYSNGRWCMRSRYVDVDQKAQWEAILKGQS